MKVDIATKPTSQFEMELYCLMGEALCKIQIVEEALSHSITLKMNSEVSKIIADEILNSRRGYTLGKAIKVAEKEKLYTPTLQRNLYSFLDKRNWLVHKVIIEYSNNLYAELDKQIFFKKIDILLEKITAISKDAESIQHIIELDMMDFCESKGTDMSKIRALIKNTIE